MHHALHVLDEPGAKQSKPLVVSMLETALAWISIRYAVRSFACVYTDSIITQFDMISKGLAEFMKTT